MRLDSWRAMEELYKEGKCRAIGVSNFLERHLNEIKEAGLSMPLINQCEFHPYYNNKDLFDTCKKFGIQFEVSNQIGYYKIQQTFSLVNLNLFIFISDTNRCNQDNMYRIILPVIKLGQITRPHVSIKSCFKAIHCPRIYYIER